MFKKHIVAIVVSSIILLLLYVTYAFISKDDIILMIQDQIEENFHQKVEFSNVSLSVLPSLKAEIDDLVLYQDTQKMVEVEKVIFNLNIETLLEKKLVIESIEVISPTIIIIPTTTPKASTDSNQSFDPQQLRVLKKLTVHNGTILYNDQYRLKQINTELHITPQMIKIVKFKAMLGQNHLNAVVNGEIDILQEALTLNIAMKTPSLRSLLQQFDANLSDGNNSLENFRFSGAVKADRKKLLLKNVKIDLDDTHIDFEAVIKDYNLSTMAFRTTIDAIDLNRYLPADINDTNRSQMQVQEQEKAKNELEPLIKIVKKLRISNSVKIGSLKIKNYELSDIFLKGKIADGKVKIDPATFKIYDGKFEGSIAVDVTGSVPEFNIKYKIKEADIEQIFKQREVPALLSGRVNLLSRITTRGNDIESLLENAEADVALFGEDLLFKKYDIDRALEGFDKVTSFDMVDLAGVVAGPLGIVLVNTYDAYEMKSDLEKGGQTKIVKLMASWKIRNLVASARDVAIKTPKNRIAIKGDIDLKQARIKRLYIGILNRQGCAKYLQKIRTLDDGSIEVDDKMNVITTPFKKLFDTGERCHVFYNGRIK